MTALIKRDLLALKGILPFMSLFIFVIVGFLLFLFWGVGYSGTPSLIAVFTIVIAFLTYGLLVQMCRREEESGVHIRLASAPIKVEKLIATRFLSPLICLLLLHVLVAIIVSPLIINQPFEVYNPSLISASIGGFLIIESVYLVFYYSFGATVASWVIRLVVTLTMIISVFDYVLLHFFPFLAVFLTNEPASLRHALLIVIVGLLMLVLSYVSAVYAYKERLQHKRQWKPVLIFCVISMFLLVLVL